MNKVFPRVNKIMAMLAITKPQAELVKMVLTEEIDSVLFKGSNLIVTSRGSHINNQMEAINTIIGGYGVEALRQHNISTDNYWMDTRAIYVNMGDTYTLTLLYDILMDRFYFTSWGDFVESAERKGAKFP